jgi:stearoyl-CoA desaturase (delta-9 desaturase)
MNNLFTVSSRSLILYHIVAHTALLYQIFFGTIIEWTITLIIYFIFFTLGGTVGFHRLLSHRSFKCSPLIEKIFTILGTIGGNGSSITWVAIHREHHKFTDTERDPHRESKGFFKIQFLSMLEIPSFRYVPDLLKSKFHLFLHKYYWLVNLIYAAVVSLYDINAVLFAYLVPTILVWHAGSLINTVNHRYGYRNIETKDKSVNNVLIGYFTSGEGWHNNHHANPSNPKFGKKWWELDLGYYIIRAIKQ